MLAVQADAANKLQFWHETILYGDNFPYRPLNQTYNTAKVNYPALRFVPTMYSNVQRNKLLFDEGCLR